MLLDDVQEQIRETAREFAVNRLAPGAAARIAIMPFPGKS